MFYTSEGRSVKRYDVGTSTQLADFAAGLPGTVAYALRILPDGGVLVADTELIVRLDNTGSVIQTYDAPGEDTWFSLNLDPDGTSFWSGNFGTGKFYKFDIASGTQLMSVDTGVGSGNLWGLVVYGEITVARPIPVYVDIKPGSWPNPINKVSTGVFAVAICGTEDFDVTTIDPAAVKIHIEGVEDGVSPLRWSYEDVATPYTGEPCGGHDLGGDGYLDLVLHFDTQEVVNTLGLCEFDRRDVVALMIKGSLHEEYDGTPIQDQDCIWILEPKGGGSRKALQK
jgi:hypothetical protein